MSTNRHNVVKPHITNYYSTIGGITDNNSTWINFENITQEQASQIQKAASSVTLYELCRMGKIRVPKAGSNCKQKQGSFPDRNILKWIC